MQLSLQTLSQIDSFRVQKPANNTLNLPERILQFGTGVLLRGLCDYYVNRANNKGSFNGRIVVVKSTSAGDMACFARQNNLYTVCVRGLSEGAVVSENIINASISRVLSASGDWEKVLELAGNPDLNIIISNTTEVGLQLTRESIHQQPPASYPAKLLAFLYERFRLLGNNENSKVVIIPTELISGNGDMLREIVLELVEYNKLGTEFSEWMNNSAFFCNSLVDRIVTKDPGSSVIAALQDELGYEDELLTMCEDYHLWAIEGDDYVRSLLTFADDDGAFVKPDISVFRALKLHLLNGTHTFSAPFAVLCGFTTVKQGMKDERFSRFVEQLMLDEIASAMPFIIAEQEKIKFGRKVLDRFSNPFLEHHWLNITLQQTTKMKNRNLPVLTEYQRKFGKAPSRMATGFAAYLLFMKAVKEENGNYYGKFHDQYYKISDDHAAWFYKLWSRHNDLQQLVIEVLQNETLWQQRLDVPATFAHAVTEKLRLMLKDGAASALNIK